ncbi:hypothetical protein NQZ68_033953 [Dissostichus eleginoides]|nr:hypothetical protein NQZ68_033953 [Dissostichus eleginoides]
MEFGSMAPVNRGEAPSSTRPAVQMSGFDLLPVDGGGGEPIHLPPGETVLGRGPLLGVSDKRVSRLHGLLENLNGRLRLKPTHLNPCFVQSLLSDDPRPLQRDVWFPLQDGDLFSLMPGQFIYRVVAVGGGDRTPRNSQMFEEKEEEERIVSPEPDVEPPPAVGQTFPQEESTPTAPSEQQEVDKRSLTKVDSAQPKEEEDKQNVISPSVTRTRVLPAWMMAAASASQSASSSYIPKVVKRSKGPSTSTKGPSTSTKGPSTSTKAAKQATPTKTSSPEEELSEEEMPKKRRRKMSDEEQEATQSKTDVPSEQPSGRLQSESNRSGISDESDGFPMEEDEEERGAGTSAANTDTQTSQISQSENEEKKMKNGRQQTKRADARLRTPCPYGKNCYRKNPMHFQESSHPGDTDYEEEEEDETQEEDLPECPFGTDCYRKNPLHRKEYKHTKKPARSTRTVHKKVGGGDDDDDDDQEDEYDDSFIDDDSEDAGDDSDYKPPVSDDSGKEDIKELQKEAKTFMKTRK